KLTAFAANAIDAPTAAIARPPSAGPKMRAPLKRLEFSPIAFGSSAGPTIAYVSACRPGASRTCVVPRSAAITYTCHAASEPVSATAASTDDSTICAACVVITSRRASSRSTTTPAKRPNTVNGMNCASASTPTATGECQPRARPGRSARLHEPEHAVALGGDVEPHASAIAATVGRALDEAGVGQPVDMAAHPRRRDPLLRRELPHADPRRALDRDEQ